MRESDATAANRRRSLSATVPLLLAVPSRALDAHQLANVRPIAVPTRRQNGFSAGGIRPTMSRSHYNLSACRAQVLTGVMSVGRVCGS